MPYNRKKGGMNVARPVNAEKRQSIEDAAFHLFDTIGYDKATYAAIAAELGISRNLVQYHFPKKEMLAIAYMEGMLAHIQAELSITDGNIAKNPRSSLVRVGTRFLEGLLQDKGKATFLRDIIRSRDLTEDVLAFNTKWAFSRLEESYANISDNHLAQRAIIFNMGGFYELLYHCLKDDEPIDLESELDAVVGAFLDAMD